MRSHAAHLLEMSPEEFEENPARLLQRWIDDAAAEGVEEPASMCLATADRAGRPSARMLLLRGLDDRGLRFFTSYFSRKGRDLAENHSAAAVFHWPALARQVRVEGTAEMLSDEESDAYFASRPRGHQLAAWASEQSEPLEAPGLLEERFAHFEGRFEEESTIPRPHSWGGYVIRPLRFEFWQGRPNRMHDRVAYARGETGWRIVRLQP